MTVTVFEFQEQGLQSTSTWPEVIKGSREAIEQYIPLTELGELFGGYIRWRASADPTEEMPGEGIGVWGRRNVSKFRQLLRDRGADIRRVKGEGPKQAHAVIAQKYD